MISLLRASVLLQILGVLCGIVMDNNFIAMHTIAYTKVWLFFIAVVWYFHVLFYGRFCVSLHDGGEHFHLFRIRYSSAVY